MAIALVAHTAAASVDTANVTTSAIDTSGATFLAAAVADYNVESPTTPSDSKSNVWTILSEVLVSNVRLRIMYVVNPSVGSGHTFSATHPLSTFPAAAFGAWSGVHVSTPFDQSNSGTATGGTTVQPGSVTPSEDNELLITAVTGISWTTEAIDSSFTVLDTVPFSGGVTFGVAWAHQIQTTATARNPTWTADAISDYCAKIATFKQAVAAVNLWLPSQYTAGVVPAILIPSGVIR